VPTGSEVLDRYGYAFDMMIVPETANMPPAP
jgi:hypothetical protein